MLLDRIEAYMRSQKMSPTRFGREAVGDPKFVLQLRDGREPRRRTVARVIQFLEKQSAASDAFGGDRSADRRRT